MHLHEEKIRDNVVGNLPSKSKNIIGHSQQIELVSGYPRAQAQFRLKEKIDQSTKLEPIAGLQEAVNKS